MKPRRPVRTTVVRDPAGVTPPPYDRDDPKHPDFARFQEQRAVAAHAAKHDPQPTFEEDRA